MTKDRKAHWEKVYAGKLPRDHSWFQEAPQTSISLIREMGLDSTARILDVGGGASSLPLSLLREGFRNVSSLDISAEALRLAKAQMGPSATKVAWIEADVLEYDPRQRWDLWHDRAVFHFLTAPEDRETYCRALARGLGPNGHVILATFSLNGPSKCSGLECVRYSSKSLGEVLGPAFLLRGSVEEQHRTPTGGTQNFVYSWFQKRFRG